MEVTKNIMNKSILQRNSEQTLILFNINFRCDTENKFKF